MRHFRLFTILAFLWPLVLFGQTSLSHYYSVVRSATGDSVAGATVAVYQAGTTIPVLLWSDRAGTTVNANPFLTDSVGGYSFYLPPGRYKIVATKVGVGTFTQDDLEIGTQNHGSRHRAVGEDPLTLGDLAGQIDSSKVADGTLVAADVSPSAGIQESKLALNFPTHSAANDPTVNQKDALAGTAGAPSSSNKYLTDSDPRNTNPRAPLAHAPSHGVAGSDPITVTLAQLLGVHLGTDLTTDLEEEAHHTEHEDEGNDEISIQGLSGLLLDPQKVQVAGNGTLAGSATRINFLDGTNTTVTVTPNAGALDVRVSGPDLTPNLAILEGITTASGNTSSLVFSSTGFDVSSTGANTAAVTLDLTELNTAGDCNGTLASCQVTALLGRTIATTSPADNQALVYNQSTSQWEPKLQDATKILGRSLCTSPSPGAGQALVWDNTSTCWGPADVSTVIGIEEGDSTVTTQAQGIDFGVGFDITDSPAGEANVALDLSEVTVSAQQLRGFNVCPGISPGSGLVLKWDGTDTCWTAATDNSSGAMGIENNGVSLMSASTTNYLPPLVGADAGGSKVSVSLSSAGVKNTHIDWGTGAGQVSTTDVPEGSNQYWTTSRFNTSFAGKSTTDLVEGTNQYWTNSRFDTRFDSGLATKTTDNLPEGASNRYLTLTQESSLTGGGDTSLHFHSSDRNLANSTGNLDASRITGTHTDAQITDALTVSSAGSVDAASLKSGIIPAARLGGIGNQIRTWLINYPATTATGYGYVYFPTAATITKIAGRTRGGTCAADVDVNGVDALTADLTVGAAGTVTSTIASPSIAAGSWVQLELASCSGVSEVSVTLVYSTN